MSFPQGTYVSTWNRKGIRKRADNIIYVEIKVYKPIKLLTFTQIRM